MNTQSLGLGALLLIGLLASGCDSGQYGKSNTTEPKTDSALMTAVESEIPGETSIAERALLAAAGAPGAGDNAEGINHYQQEHWDVAQEHFDKALAANADLPEAHYNLALSLDKLGNHGGATEHFKMALNLAPEDPRIKDSQILKAHVGG